MRKEVTLGGILFTIVACVAGGYLYFSRQDSAKSPQIDSNSNPNPNFIAPPTTESTATLPPPTSSPQSIEDLLNTQRCVPVRPGGSMFAAVRELKPDVSKPITIGAVTIFGTNIYEAPVESWILAGSEQGVNFQAIKPKVSVACQ